MISKLICIIASAILLVACSSSSKHFEASPEINNQAQQFFVNSSIATHLVNYDKMAWVTSDTLKKYYSDQMKMKVGSEWFGYSHNNKMYFVFGKYENKSYSKFKRYVLDDERIIEAKDGSDLIEELYAKAINIVIDSAYSKMRDIGHRFNWYVYQDKIDSSVVVYFLPSLGPNGELVYGREFSFVLTKSADSIISVYDDFGKLNYYEPNVNSEITIADYNEMTPSIGNLYYADRWGFLFGEVNIQTKSSLHRLIDHNGTKVWSTINKQKPANNR
jgi:hypothetical protein